MCVWEIISSAPLSYTSLKRSLKVKTYLFCSPHCSHHLAQFLVQLAINIYWMNIERKCIGRKYTSGCPLSTACFYTISTITFDFLIRKVINKMSLYFLPLLEMKRQMLGWGYWYCYKIRDFDILLDS